MAYKNFQVIKEIYIPVDLNDDGISLDEYKQEYGIDLNELCLFDGGGITLKPKAKGAKLFIVSEHGVYPLITLDNNGDLEIGAYYKHVPDASDLITSEGFIGFAWDNGNQVLSVIEI